MRLMRLILVAGIACCMLEGSARAADPSPKELINKMLEHDFWGLSGAEIKATALLKDKLGKSRTLVIEAQSRKHKGFLTKSLVRFRSPPDLAGAGFLQIQNDGRDDDRFLYLPELKRSRRVAASQRSTSFMGTDFNFADMDRRDLREAQYKAGPNGKVGKFECHHVTVIPTRGDSPYSRIEVDIRKDDFVPLKMEMFDKAKVHLKTLNVFQIKRVTGRWFITKSQMVNHKENHSTLLVLNEVKPTDSIPDSRFTEDNLKR